MPEEIGQYGLSLPDPVELDHRFKYKLDYWVPGRNKFITDIRKMLNGQNKISAPQSTQYKVKVLHTYILAALINEKTSRYTRLPNIQAIPDDDIDPEGRAKSSRIEKGINTANYEMDRQGDADVWGRAVRDAILIDGAVTKTVRAVNPFWTELVAHDKAAEEAKEKGEEFDLVYPMQSDERIAYKKEHGIPITRTYVPLEAWFPEYDGPNLIEAFEIEERSIRSVLNNPLFRNDESEEAISGLIPGPDGGLGETVNLIQYINNNHHAYYLAGRGPNSGKNKSLPLLQTNQRRFQGKLQKLYSYEHGLGRSLFNHIGGRFGGWKTNYNDIEGVGKGLLELSQAADEIMSQVVTNVRAKYWPTLIAFLDPEMRGISAGGSVPEAPKVKEGETLVMYKGEELGPVFQPEDDPMAIWIYDKIQEAVSKLGGSPVLFGGREPGVDTGFHQAIQQTSAESLDEKMESNISIGAQQDAMLIMLHTKKIAEPVYMHYAETVDLDDGKRRKVGKYVVLDPDDLTPLPRLDAQVQKPSPMNMLSATRLAKELSEDREGKGPLMSDDSIREKILAMSEPDVEWKKILVESQMFEIIKSGVLSKHVGEQLNVKLATTGVPEITPEMLANADPELLAAISESASLEDISGGINPGTLAGIAETTGIPPGPQSGDPEQANREGEAALADQQTGGGAVV